MEATKKVEDRPPTSYSSWKEWKQKCALHRCSESTKNELGQFGLERVALKAKRIADGNFKDNVIAKHMQGRDFLYSIAPNELSQAIKTEIQPHIDKDKGYKCTPVPGTCWSLFLEEYLQRRTKKDTAKRWKDNMFDLHDGSLSGIRVYATHKIVDAILDNLVQLSPWNLDETASPSGESDLADSLLREPSDPSAHEEVFVLQAVNEFLKTLSHAEKVALLANRLGKPVGKPCVIEAACVSRDALYSASKSAKESYLTLRTKHQGFELMLEKSLQERLFDWGKSEKRCEPLFC